MRKKFYIFNFIILLLLLPACNNPQTAAVIQEIDWKLKDCIYIEVGGNYFLPDTVTAIYNNNTSEEIDVEWQGEINTISAGVYNVRGVISDSYLLSESVNRTKEIRLFIGDIIESVISPDSIEIEQGDDLVLPGNVGVKYVVKYIDGKQDTAAVEWDTSLIDTGLAGEYEITGIVSGNFLPGVSNQVVINVNIKEKPAVEKQIISVESLAGVTIYYNQTHILKNKITVYYDDGSNGQLPVVWHYLETIISEFTGSSGGTFEITGRIDGFTEDIIFEITVLTGNIVESIVSPEGIEIEQDGDLILPDTVVVKYIDGNQDTAAVIWDTSLIDTGRTGEYEITGIVSGDFLPGVSNQVIIKVNIKEKPAVDKQIISVENLAGVTIYYNQTHILKNIITVYYDDGSNGQLPVVWHYSETIISEFTGSSGGVYEIIGRIEDYSEDIKFEITVIKNAVSAQAIDDKRVEKGEVHGLPDKTEVTYDGGAKELVDIIWEDSVFNSSVPAIYSIKGYADGIELNVKVYVGEIITEVIGTAGGISNYLTGDDIEIPLTVGVRYFGIDGVSYAEIIWTGDIDNLTEGIYQIEGRINGVFAPGVKMPVFVLTVSVYKRITGLTVTFDTENGLLSWTDPNNKDNIEHYIIRFGLNGKTQQIFIDDTDTDGFNLKLYGPGTYGSVSIEIIGKENYNSVLTGAAGEYTLALSAAYSGAIIREDAAGFLISWSDANPDSVVSHYIIQIKAGTEIVFSASPEDKFLRISYDYFNRTNNYKVFITSAGKEGYINSPCAELLEFSIIQALNLSADGATGIFSWEGDSDEIYIDNSVVDIEIKTDDYITYYIKLPRPVTAGKYELAILIKDVNERNEFGILAIYEYIVYELGTVTEIVNDPDNNVICWSDIEEAASYKITFTEAGSSDTVEFTVGTNEFIVGADEAQIIAGIYSVTVMPYAGLSYQYIPAELFSIDKFYISGSGADINTARLIYNKETLESLSGTGYYLIAESFDIGSGENANVSAPVFGGILDGNNKVIGGLSNPLIIDLYGTVKDLTLNVAIDSPDLTKDGVTVAAMGAVACYLLPDINNGGGKITGCIVTGSINTGSTAADVIGGLIGQIGKGADADNIGKSASVTDCRSYVNITAGNQDYIGGIAGQILLNRTDNSDCNYFISDCIYYGNITSGNNRGVGGIAGRNAAMITDSANAGTITAGDVRNAAAYAGIGGVGGIAGINADLITRCYTLNTSFVEGYKNVGGIAGAHIKKIAVSNNFNAGKVKGNENIGGIVGQISTDNTAEISYCFNIGTVEGASGYAGGILGARYSTGEPWNSQFVRFTYNAGIMINAGATVGFDFVLTNCFALSGRSYNSQVLLVSGTTTLISANELKNIGGTLLVSGKLGTSGWKNNRLSGGEIAGFVVLEFMVDENGILLDKFAFINQEQA